MPSPRSLSHRERVQILKRQPWGLPFAFTEPSGFSPCQTCAWFIVRWRVVTPAAVRERFALEQFTVVVHDITGVVLAVRAPCRVRRIFSGWRCRFRFHVQQVRRGAAQFAIADGQAHFILLRRRRLWRCEGRNRFVLTGNSLTILGTPGIRQLVAIWIGRAFGAQEKPAHPLPLHRSDRQSAQPARGSPQPAFHPALGLVPAFHRRMASVLA